MVVNKQAYLKKLNKRFDNMDYAKIPVSNDIPNHQTLAAIKGPHFLD